MAASGADTPEAARNARAAYRGRHAGGAYAAASRGGSGTRASRRSSSIRVRAPARSNRSVASRSPARLSTVSCARAASNAARKAMISPSTPLTQRLIDECAAVSRRVRPTILARPSAIENPCIHGRRQAGRAEGALAADLRGTRAAKCSAGPEECWPGPTVAFQVQPGTCRLGTAEGGGSAVVRRFARRLRSKSVRRLVCCRPRIIRPSAAPLPACRHRFRASVRSCVGSNDSCPEFGRLRLYQSRHGRRVRPRRALRALLERLTGCRPFGGRFRLPAPWRRLVQTAQSLPRHSCRVRGSG